MGPRTAIGTAIVAFVYALAYPYSAALAAPVVLVILARQARGAAVGRTFLYTALALPHAMVFGWAAASMVPQPDQAVQLAAAVTAMFVTAITFALRAEPQPA
jgi:hypothetical protein